MVATHSHALFFSYGDGTRTRSLWLMKPKCSPFTLPRDVWVIISADPLAMTLRCQTASFEHNLSNHKNTQVIGLSVSYVTFTLRTAMLSIDARIGIEPISQEPKSCVLTVILPSKLLRKCKYTTYKPTCKLF